MFRRSLCFSVLALAGCSLAHREGDLSLRQRPDLTVALSVPDMPPSVRQVRYDEEPEKLPPPKSEPRKDDESNNEPKDRRKDRVRLVDDVPRSGGELTLRAAVQLCLSADPKLKAAAELIVQAQADVVTAATRPNPTLSVFPSQMPLFSAFKPNRQGGPPQLEIDLSYPVDWCLFGKLAAEVASAQVGIDVSEMDYAEALRQRVEQVVIAYYDQLEAQSLVRLARQDLETLQRTEQTLEMAVKAGGKAEVDLSRVRLDRLRSEQTLREAESARRQAQVRLLALLGRKNPGPDFSVEGSLEGELLEGDVSSDALYAAAEASRPDVRSARAQLEKAKAEVAAEDRKAYPELTIRGQYMHQFQRTTIGFPDADSFGVGFDSTLPCYNRNQGARSKARSRVAQQTHELERSLVDLRAEIERLAQDYRLAAANARAVTSEQLKLAASIRDAIDKAYLAGGRPLLDLLDAQRNYREVLRAQATTRANYYRAAYRLQNATGVKIQR